MSKVTADTITDGQIRGLRDSSPVNAEHYALYWDCVCALGSDPSGRPAAVTQQNEARAICAAAWNARHGGDDTSPRRGDE